MIATSAQSSTSNGSTSRLQARVTKEWWGKVVALTPTLLHVLQNPRKITLEERGNASYSLVISSTLTRELNALLEMDSPIYTHAFRGMLLESMNSMIDAFTELAIGNYYFANSHYSCSREMFVSLLRHIQAVTKETN